MLLDIKYTIPDSGIGNPLNIISNDGVCVTGAMTWFGGALCLNFSSMQDIDKAIIQLHKLRKETLEHIKKTGCNFIPKVLQNDDEPTVDITIYEPEELKASISEDKNKDMDVITLQYGGEHEDLAHQKINIYVPSGMAKRLGLKILLSALEQEGTITLKEYEEERKGKLDE